MTESASYAHESNGLNVGELRNLLADLPPDMELRIMVKKYPWSDSASGHVLVGLEVRRSLVSKSADVAEVAVIEASHPTGNYLRSEA